MPMKAYACPRCLTLSSETADGDGGPHTCIPSPLVAALEARVEKLEAAVEKALEWFYNPDENPLVQFERVGGMFYIATGHLRPGKDDLLEDTDSPENRKRFQDWCMSKSREAIAALNDSLAE